MSNLDNQSTDRLKQDPSLSHLLKQESKDWAQAFVDNLNRNVLKDEEERRWQQSMHQLFSMETLSPAEVSELEDASKKLCLLLEQARVRCAILAALDRDKDTSRRDLDNHPSLRSLPGIEVAKAMYALIVAKKVTEQSPPDFDPDIMNNNMLYRKA